MFVHMELALSGMKLVVFVRIGCFFFKQKTAYEMRISDWSSDVCSSDLPDREAGGDRGDVDRHHQTAPALRHDGLHPGLADHPQIGRASCRERVCQYV